MKQHKSIDMSNFITLPTYNEKTIPMSGWYWHEPSGGIPYQKPRFVEVSEEVLDGSLHCKMYQGTYAGPIQIKK